MIDPESAIYDRLEMARGDRATPETAQGDVIEAYHTGRIAGLRTALEIVQRSQEQAQAQADQRARTDGGDSVLEDDPGVSDGEGQDPGTATAYGDVLERLADAAERQADAAERQAAELEAIQQEQRFQSAALADVAYRLTTLEEWARVDQPGLDERTRSHRGFINGLADHNFERAEFNERPLAGYRDLLPDGRRED